MMNEINKNVMKHLDYMLERYPALTVCKNDIIEAFLAIKNCYENNGKLLLAGNGGSAADCDHIVGELMKGFCKRRYIDSEFGDNLIKSDEQRGVKLSENLHKGLPAISLTNHLGLNTAFLNDVDGLMCYAQQLSVYANVNDVFLGISTSGNAENVAMACVVARAKGIKIIALTGANANKLEDLSDIKIKVPATETFEIQEYHLPIYHCICLMLEEHFFEC